MESEVISCSRAWVESQLVLGLESWMVGRCLQALLASADGAQLINALQLEKH